MAQLPMIYVGKLPIFRRNKTVGNIVFWIGLMSGFPLLLVPHSHLSSVIYRHLLTRYVPSNSAIAYLVY